MIFVVSGPGGVGKGTLVRRLLGRIDGIELSRSWTTRPRRPGEDEGAYVWADTSQFEAKIEAGGFLEWNRLPSNGFMYGTPKPETTSGDDLLLEIELNGATQIKQRYPDAVLVFVTAPSLEALASRMTARGDDPDSVARRLELGRSELDRGPAMADFVVVNDDVDRATDELLGIIVSCRARPS